MHTPRTILLTGGAGFLGSSVLKEMRTRWGNDVNVIVPKRPEADLRNRATCERLVKSVDTIIHLAAHVGGIGYNQKNPGTLFYDNAIMGIELMEAARKADVVKFVVIGTVCAYPKFTPVPFKESDLWIGYPEETNASYGLAKKMLLVQAQAYRSQFGFNVVYLLPVNLYGPHDDFDPSSSHVIPALIRKMVEAEEMKTPIVLVWGTGAASREFCFVRDAAKAIVLATEQYDDPAPLNIGSGREISIKNLAELIKSQVGYKGEIVWDTSRPDGQPRRCLDINRAKELIQFEAETSFEKGIKETIEWYRQNRI